MSYYIKKLTLLSSVYFAMFLIVFFSKELGLGIKNGIAVSLNLIIPSLFIFMIFSNMIINSSLCKLISRPFRLIATHVFRITERQMSIVILSLIGGYPIGAKLIANEIKHDRMSPKRGTVMLSYCVNCGPAFLISGVGIGIFNNYKIGLIIFISQLVACLVVGFLASFLIKDEPNFNPKPTVKEKQSPSTLMVNSVNEAVKALCVISGFIVAFSALMPVVAVYAETVSEELSMLLQGFLEVTTACAALGNSTFSNTIVMAAAFTAFGGICVLLQVCGMLNGTGVKLKWLLISRVLYTIISVVIVNFLLVLYPNAFVCISLTQSQASKVYSVSPIATVFMIFLSLMLLFFCRKSDRI